MLNLFPETIAKSIEGLTLITSVIMPMNGSIPDPKHWVFESFYPSDRYSLIRRGRTQSKDMRHSHIGWIYGLTNATALYMFLAVYLFDNDDIVISVHCPDKLFIDISFYITNINSTNLPRFHCTLRHSLYNLQVLALKHNEVIRETLCKIRCDAQNKIQIKLENDHPTTTSKNHH
jgi:hypothetical protein